MPDRLAHACARRHLPLLLLMLLLLAPIYYAQSGRNKQQTTNKPSTPSTGTTRPKRVNTGIDSQSQKPAGQSAPARLPNGTVVMDEAPPRAPTPKPTPVVNTSAGEEIGAEDVVKITSNLVTVPASVVDSQGRAVTDLKLEDFELRVDGQPKTISELSRSEVPVTLALLFDNSESLQSAREFEKQAAVRFFRSVIRPIDRAAIYSVATEVDLVQPLTNSVPALVRTIEHFGKPEGATKLLDAIVEATKYLKPYPGRKVIVIVSDGEDTISDTSFDDTLRRVLAADCQIYAVQTKQIEYVMLTGETANANVRSLAAERRLQDLTSHTGGAVYTPLQTSDLDAAFSQISADLAQQYILSYYPSDDRADGRFRTISVRVSTRPNMKVRARRGYYPHRPNDRFSYSAPTQGEPAMNQEVAATIQNSSQKSLPQTDALSILASTGNASQPTVNVPARSRRVGPSDMNDDVEAGSNVKAVSAVSEPIIKGDAVTSKAADASPPPPKPSPSPQPTPTPSSEGKQPILNPSPTPVSQSSSNNNPPASKPAPPAKDVQTNSPSPAARPIKEMVFPAGVINGKAIHLPKPLYPLSARNMHAEGIVNVEVVLDEDGKVVSAKAVDG
ncbi:MAG: VWA domain-containing protein, partial [Acidobacteriota bacterium]|nr:VWA domain-containing protein [Acidobacteriota bacterium]